jgi:hypothetical protein
MRSQELHKRKSRTPILILVQQVSNGGSFRDRSLILTLFECGWTVTATAREDNRSRVASCSLNRFAVSSIPDFSASACNATLVQFQTLSFNRFIYSLYDKPSLMANINSSVVSQNVDNPYKIAAPIPAKFQELPHNGIVRSEGPRNHWIVFCSVRKNEIALYVRI